MFILCSVHRRGERYHIRPHGPDGVFLATLYEAISLRDGVVCRLASKKD